MFFFDFPNFTLNLAMILRDSVKFRHCHPGFLNATLAISKARRFWEEKDPQAEDERPDETDAHWYAPGARIRTLFSTKIDGVRGKDSRCDEKLVSAH